MANTILESIQGGTGFGTYTLGDLLYGNTNLVKLAGNTTSTKKFLSQTGNGTISAVPSWVVLTNTDVGLGSVENTTLSTWAGTANITTLGTIATGTWNATAIGATKGGTGITSYSQGDVIYSSASNTLAALAAGTAGYVLKTGGAGANPSWATEGLQLLSSATASASAQIDLTWSAGQTYQRYLVIMSGVLPATTSVSLQAFTTADGVTWDSGASNYSWSQLQYSSAAFSAGDTKIQVSGTTTLLTNTANQDLSGEVKIYDAGATAFGKMNWQLCTNSGGVSRIEQGSGTRLSAGVIRGIRFKMSSGNISTGNFRLYGVVR